MAADVKTIRDSPSLGRGAEKDGQPRVADQEPIRDSLSLGRGAEKDGRPPSAGRGRVRDSLSSRLGLRRMVCLSRLLERPPVIAHLELRRVASRFGLS